ncbi:MAG: hypothetical protein IKT40_06185 [Bacilli bacterium]|nr:hypothetical protein [Bacilli bacterium]
MSAATIEKRAYACLLTTESYYKGALVLMHQLNKLKSNYSLICIINSNISSDIKIKLKKANIILKEIEQLEIPDYIYTQNKEKGFPHWSYGYEKIYLHTLTDWDKIIYLDLDLLLLKNIDFLFDFDFPFAPFNFTSDNFCSGLLGIYPNLNDYIILKEQLFNCFKNGEYITDQQLLNKFYKNYINFLDNSYNVYSSIFHLYMNEKEWVIIHFNDIIKPFCDNHNIILNNKYYKIYYELIKEIEEND